MFHFIAKAFSSVVLGVSSMFGLHHTAVVPPIATSTAAIHIEATTTAPLPAVAKPVLQKIVSPAKAVTQTSASTGTTVTVPIIAPPGTLSCNGSFWKSQYVCPSGQELVCPATGNPVCQWTAASAKALADQKAIEEANARITKDASISYTKQQINVLQQEYDRYTDDINNVRAGIVKSCTPSNVAVAGGTSVVQQGNAAIAAQAQAQQCQSVSIAAQYQIQADQLAQQDIQQQIAALQASGI